MVDKLRGLYTAGLLWLFLRLGTTLYKYVHMPKPNNQGRLMAIHFAVNEREMRISVREFVEWLDEQYEEQGRN